MDNPIYKVQIYNNLRLTEPGVFYNSRPRCEFCSLEHKDNCDFTFNNPELRFRDVIRTLKQSQRNSLVMSVVWRQSSQSANFALLEKREVVLSGE